MLLDLRTSDGTRGRAALDATAALRALEATGHPRPILLPYHPANPSPYLDLLYSTALEEGVAAVPLARITDAAGLVPLAAISGARVVLHLHWLGKVLDGATDMATALRQVTAYSGELDALRAASVGLAWTVHNILPHGATLPDAEVALRRAVVAHADVVHVMSAATEALVANQFTIPGGRVLAVPHPSMESLYPRWMSRAEARRRLDVPGSARVIGMLGALQPYKGLEDLLDAVPDAVARVPGLRVVVAGAPDPGEEMQRLVDRAVADPRVMIHPRHVADADLQVIMRAADAVVVPYRDVLNSASLMLALAFGRRVIFPRHPALAEFEGAGVAVTYEGGRPGALAAGIAEAHSLPEDGVAEAARAICEARDAARLGRAFASGLQARIP